MQKCPMNSCGLLFHRGVLSGAQMEMSAVSEHNVVDLWPLVDGQNHFVLLIKIATKVYGLDNFQLLA